MCTPKFYHLRPLQHLYRLSRGVGLLMLRICWRSISRGTPAAVMNLFQVTVPLRLAQTCRSSKRSVLTHGHSILFRYNHLEMKATGNLGTRRRLGADVASRIQGTRCTTNRQKLLIIVIPPHLAFFVVPPQFCTVTRHTKTCPLCA